MGLGCGWQIGEGKYRRGWSRSRSRSRSFRGERIGVENGLSPRDLFAKNREVHVLRTEKPEF